MSTQLQNPPTLSLGQNDILFLEKLYLTLEALLQGFYQKMGFLVLPSWSSAGLYNYEHTLINKYNQFHLITRSQLKKQQLEYILNKLIVLPKQLVTGNVYANALTRQIISLINKKKRPLQLNVIEQRKLIDLLNKNRFYKNNNLMHNSITKYQKFIQTTTQKIFKRVIPNLSNALTPCNITVAFTSIGSRASFFYLKQKSCINTYLILRPDITQNSLAYALISALLLPVFDMQHFSDIERQKTMNFIFEYIVPFANFSMEATVPKQYFPLYKKSIEYINSLDFMTQRNVDAPALTLKNNYLFIDNKNTKIKFPNFEAKLLQALLNKYPDTLTYTEIAYILWDNDSSKFSLWAISRLIYKIRKKLKKLQSLNLQIQNVPNVGYVVVM